MIRIVRPTAADAIFRGLTRQLDVELRAIYGAIQDTYEPHNELRDDPAVVAVLDPGEEPIGCGCIRQLDPATVELKRMFVTPARRGTGVGRAILAELETWARELGHRAIVLETGTRQLDAIALYERSGYGRIAAYGPYAGLEYSVCMRKSLLTESAE